MNFSKHITKYTPLLRNTVLLGTASLAKKFRFLASKLQAATSHGALRHRKWD